MRSAPLALQTARNGGSLTSSIGANNNGKSGNDMFPIFIKMLCILYQAYLATEFANVKTYHWWIAIITIQKASLTHPVFLC